MTRHLFLDCHAHAFARIFAGRTSLQSLYRALSYRADMSKASGLCDMAQPPGNAVVLSTIDCTEPFRDKLSYHTTV